MELLSWVPQRYVFAIMAFLGSVIAYMIRISVELTIHHMVNGTNSLPPALFDPNSCPNIIMINNNETTALGNERKGSLNWDTITQGKVTAAYGGAYFMTQFIGGMIADTYGGKKIFGIVILVSGVLTMLIPLSAVFINSTAVFVLRFVTGLAGGTIIPVQMSMLSKWATAEERSFIASIIFPGILLGRIAASYMVDPLSQLAGWQSVYYLFGVMGLIWAIVWKFTCYSNPNEHPNISEYERVYLNENNLALKRMKKYDLDPLPFKAFVPCIPFWAIVIGYCGQEWGFFTLTTQVPQYMQDVLRLDIAGTHLEYQMYFCKWVFALIFGFTSYILVARGVCSIKFIRQISTSFGAIVSSVCIIIIMYSGCDAVKTIFFMYIGVISLGAYYSGAMIAMMDMNPNYAGTMIGVVDNVSINSVVPLRSLQSLIVSDALLSQWRLLLWVVCFFIILSLAIYIYFLKAEQIWWDDVRQNGYPSDWKRGLFPANAEIDENGQTVLKQRKDTETVDDKLNMTV